MKEIHLVLDRDSIRGLEAVGQMVYTNYCDTLKAYNDTNTNTVFTTITHFLSFKYSYMLFVHVNNHTIFIRKGKTYGTDRYITEATNLEKLLFSGEFSWFKP